MQHIERDIAVIGAGPTGLFSVFSCGFLGYSCVIIDALEESGGQLAALYPEKPIYDIPGHPDILATSLIKNLQQQIAPFNPEYLMGYPAETLEKQEDGTFIITTKKATIKAKAVVIAGGGGQFTPRKPPVKGIEPYEDKSLFYSVRNKNSLKDKNIVIAGGGDSAVDWAIELAPIAKHIHIVHRRADFRAAEESVRKLNELAKNDNTKNGNISIHTPCNMTNIEGNDGQITAVNIETLEGEKQSLAADVMLCFFGLAPNPSPFADWGLEVKGKTIITKPITQKTCIDGIVAVGDIAAYEGKIHLILVGFAESSQAARTLQAYISPDKKFRISYSTSKKPGS